MPHRTVKLKIALNKTYSSSYQEFQDLRDGLVAAFVDWPIEKWDIADAYMPTNTRDIPSGTLVSQKTREWLQAIANNPDIGLPSSRAEATPERLKKIQDVASMIAI